jgi:hypothetical protein
VIRSGTTLAELLAVRDGERGTPTVSLATIDKVAHPRIDRISSQAVHQSYPVRVTLSPKQADFLRRFASGAAVAAGTIPPAWLSDLEETLDAACGWAAHKP